ncbi:MAG: hypothetical protein Q8R28_07640 [Dehalococcoidia bacterium]|nr:hypothetical protein [Dehalococcoidia bacterium]
MVNLTDLIGSVALVLAVVQMFKPLVKNTAWHPFIAVLLGIGINYYLVWASVTTPEISLTRVLVAQAIMSGLVAGLAAGGLYDKMHDAGKPVSPAGGTP